MLSREINKYFQEKDHNPKEFDNLLNAAKTITIDDLRSEEFVNNKNHSKFSLYITGTYKYIEVPVADKYNKSDTELYTLHDRKTCFHEGLYDPFKFEESQTWISYRYLNTTPTRKLIDSVFTLKFALAELTVLYLDGTYVKIQASDIPSFLEKHLKNNEINLDLYKSVQKDYPKLFLPPIDLKTLDALYQQLKQLMVHHFQEASRTGKPLLLLLSEVHGSKESFLFHSIILLIANSLAIKHLLVETINVYHAQYGWDAQVTEINTLMSYAKKDLRMQVTDLEAALHYKNHFCPYPYHDIPEPHFGIEARESSWIIDTEQTKEHKVMIVGSGHINNLLKSPLKESHYILPIDCSGDKAFSDMLSISQHHFISLDKKISHLSLDPSVPATVRQK